MFQKFNRLRKIYYDSYHIAKETSSVELRVLQYFASRSARPDTPAAADAHRPRKVALSLEILRLYGS